VRSSVRLAVDLEFVVGREARTLGVNLDIAQVELAEKSIHQCAPGGCARSVAQGQASFFANHHPTVSDP
jgi:hypothetical protein